ncbi:hypothetical protein, partial [Mesonia sp. HuA40]|uniref:hypothetical protein n=1 Tax=Mesonia sp. HuA40 TaxID=2602761 RepID=UPI001C9BE472
VTALAMISLRKNTQDLFRCSSKIEKRMEFSVENSAAMNYSRCYILWRHALLGRFCFAVQIFFSALIFFPSTFLFCNALIYF